MALLPDTDVSRENKCNGEEGVSGLWFHSSLSTRGHSVVTFVQNAVLIMVMLLCNGCRESSWIFVGCGAERP
jgi:hypothetical protein